MMAGSGKKGPTADSARGNSSGDADGQRVDRRQKAQDRRERLIAEHRAEAASHTFETSDEVVIDGNAFLKPTAATKEEEETASSASVVSVGEPSSSTLSGAQMPGWQLPQIGGEDWQENPDPVAESDPLEKARVRLAALEGKSALMARGGAGAGGFSRTLSARAEEEVRHDQCAQGRRVAVYDEHLHAEGHALPPFEVYVHVPYCYRRCGYCDFNTYVTQDFGEGASQRDYAATAVQEMRRLRLWQEMTGQPSRLASTVYFGGGTPTLLPTRDLAAMLREIQTLWGLAPGVEVTTEANPDTVSAASIRQLADAGFTRLSLGMQSAVPHVLKTLDRTHRQKNVELAVRWAKNAGLSTSVDLIYGTPGESMDDWRTSLEAAISLGTDHISCYALTLAPQTRMGRQVKSGEIAPPSDDDEAAKYRLADELLSAAGYRWYEISNWAKPGKEDRHNLGYWRGADWAGIGPGAHAHYGRLRTWDSRHPLVWTRQIRRQILPWAGSEWVDDTENVEETVMLGLRLREGLSLDRVAQTAGMPVGAATLERLQAEDLIERFDGPDGEPRIRPTLRGRLLNDAVISVVLDDLL
jgi:putative oxygen-independent coproporphyrinogen III oxidase